MPSMTKEEVDRVQEKIKIQKREKKEAMIVKEEEVEVETKEVVIEKAKINDKWLS